MDDLIRELLREEMMVREKTATPPTSDKPAKAEKETEDGEDSESARKAKYQKIKGLLANPIFNHAEIAKHLWGDKEATNRSLFRKKLEMELNDSGEPYMFDDEEIAKIGSKLRDTSKAITKTVGRKSS